MKAGAARDTQESREFAQDSVWLVYDWMTKRQKLLPNSLQSIQLP